jgi:hypothetical protein
MFTKHIFRVLKSRRMGLAGHVACMEEVRNAYKISVGKPEDKRPFRRHRGRSSRKRLLKRILRKRCEVVEWIHLAQDEVQSGRRILFAI